MGLSPAEYQIPALMIASILYGLNLLTFCSSLRQVCRGRDGRKRGRDVNLPMAAVVIILFVCSTASVSLQLVHAMRGNNFLMDSHSSDFELERNKIDVAKMALVVLVVVIADGVLLYRCWLIWNRSFLIILLPLLTWIGCLGSSIYAVQCLDSRIYQEHEPIVLSRDSIPGIMTFWTCTIVENLYCTGMIVWRIYSVQRGWKPPTICSLRDVPQRADLQLASRILLESAIMYTVASLGSFITHICRSVWVEIPCLAEVQIIGIAFNLILIRPSCSDREHENELSVVEYSNQEASRPTVSVGVGTMDTYVEIP